VMDWDEDTTFGHDDYDGKEYEPIQGRVVSETPRAYKVIKADLTTFWVPKSVSQDDGTGGLVVQNWFIEKEGLDQ